MACGHITHRERREHSYTTAAAFGRSNDECVRYRIVCSFSLFVFILFCSSLAFECLRESPFSSFHSALNYTAQLFENTMEKQRKQSMCAIKVNSKKKISHMNLHRSTYSWFLRLGDFLSLNVRTTHSHTFNQHAIAELTYRSIIQIHLDFISILMDTFFSCEFLAQLTLQRQWASRAIYCKSGTTNRLCFGTTYF